MRRSQEMVFLEELPMRSMIVIYYQLPLEGMAIQDLEPMKNTQYSQHYPWVGIFTMNPFLEMPMRLAYLNLGLVRGL